tara:strand:- start:7460 stop:8608 length:1149 start_codon:yes stop_codon:yes gene_type:complete
MAITMTASPDTISAAYIPIVWTCTSSTGTIARIIADVYIDGSVKASIDKDPDFGTSNAFTFDVQSVVQDYLTYNLETVTTNDVVNAGSSEVEVQLKLYEVTESGGSLSTVWVEGGSATPDQTSSQIWAVNATRQHEEAQNLDAYTVDTTDKLWLTNGGTQKIGRSETIQLHFLTNEADVKVKIQEYNSGGGLVASTAVPSSPLTVSDKAGILKFNGSTLNASTSYVNFILAKGDLSADRSETIRFNVQDVCRDDKIRVKWINPLGGIDSFTFISETNKEVRFRSKTYEQVIEKGFAVADRGRTVLNVNAEEAIDVYSDSLTTAQLNWISEIGRSNGVWLEDGSNLVPVIVTSRKVKTLNNNNKIFQASYKLVKSNKFNTQRN